MPTRALPLRTLNSYANLHQPHGSVGTGTANNSEPPCSSHARVRPGSRSGRRPAHVVGMTKREHAPTFWMTGELTGGELIVADSPGDLIASVLEGYGALPPIPAGEYEPGEMFRAWGEIRTQDRFAFACQVATQYQARALVKAEKDGVWSLAGETDDAIDRLYTTRSRVPDNRPWPAGSGVRLILVHPVMEGIDWEPPETNRSLTVIDPRSESRMLLGFVSCGALSSAGRIDARSRVQHPLGL